MNKSISISRSISNVMFASRSMFIVSIVIIFFRRITRFLSSVSCVSGIVVSSIDRVSSFLFTPVARISSIDFTIVRVSRFGISCVGFVIITIVIVSVLFFRIFRCLGYRITGSASFVIGVSLIIPVGLIIRGCRSGWRVRRLDVISRLVGGIFVGLIGSLLLLVVIVGLLGLLVVIMLAIVFVFAFFVWVVRWIRWVMSRFVIVFGIVTRRYCRFGVCVHIAFGYWQTTTRRRVHRYRTITLAVLTRIKLTRHHYPVNILEPDTHRTSKMIYKFLTFFFFFLYLTRIFGFWILYRHQFFRHTSIDTHTNASHSYIFFCSNPTSRSIWFLLEIFGGETKNFFLKGNCSSEIPKVLESKHQFTQFTRFANSNE